MGNNQNDINFSQKAINVANSYKRKHLYFWVDENIFKSQQNKAYLTILKEFIEIRPFNMWKAFMFQLDSLDHKPPTTIILITSMCLPPQVYAIFLAEPKINSIILFDKSQLDERQLIATYPKIKKRFASFQDLLAQIRQTLVAQKQLIHFYCQQQMQRLNRWMINWLIFQQLSREKGKKDFLSLSKLITPISSDLKRYQKSYDLNKLQAQRDNMVLQWISLKNFYTTIPIEMLTTCKDTFELSLIRQPLFDIKNAIRANYALTSYPQLTVYTLVSLNLHQIRRFQQANFKYIYFSTFMICSISPCRKRLYPNQFRLTIKLKEKTNNNLGGYYINEDEVIININNAFKVFEANLQKGQILLQLVQFTKKELQQNKQLAQLELHKQYIRYLVRIIPGQILSSYMNGQLPKYKQFINNQLSNLRNSNKDYYYVRKLVTKLQMVKIKLYFHLQDEKDLEEELFQIKKIIRKLDKDKDQNFFKVKRYFLLIEMYLRMNEFTNFGKSIRKLKELQRQQGGDFSQQQTYKLKIYSLYCYLSTNKSHIEQNMDLLQQIETQVNTKLREDTQVSELYTIIMLTKIKSQQLSGNYKKAISLFEQLINSIKTCQGTNSIYNYYAKLKRQLQIKFLKMAEERQRWQKQKRINSCIPLQKLLLLDNFQINFTGINLNLYQLQ